MISDRPSMGKNNRGRVTYCFYNQAETKNDLQTCTSLVASSIDKTSPRTTKLCSSRETQLKWCHEHINFTISHWGKVTAESIFIL